MHVWDSFTQLKRFFISIYNFWIFEIGHVVYMNLKEVLSKGESTTPGVVGGP